MKKQKKTLKVFESTSNRPFCFPGDDLETFIFPAGASLVYANNCSSRLSASASAIS
jgi:hypothetical protein